MALLLCLLVQLHVRHQDVLLRLLAQPRVGAAVASAFVGATRADAAPAVQEDQARHQRHQSQARHQHHDEDGQVITAGCKEAQERTEQSQTRHGRAPKHWNLNKEPKVAAFYLFIQCFKGHYK